MIFINQTLITISSLLGNNILAANCQYNLASWDQLLLIGLFVDPFNIGLISSGFNQWAAHHNPQWGNSHITRVLLKII